MTYKKINIIDLKVKFAHETLYFKEYIEFNIKEQNERNKKVAQWLKEEIEADIANESVLKMVYHDDFIKLPSYFYHSTIVSIYSLLESTLMEICERAKLDLELQLSVNDFSTRDNLGKIVTYLEKLVDIYFNKEAKEWNLLRDFRTLRNMIVHQNSRFIKEPTKSEIDLIKRLKYVQMNQSDFTFYVIDSILITTFLDSVCKLIETIFNQIEHKEYRLMEVKNKFYSDLPF